MTRVQARWQTVLALGGVEQTKEQVRADGDSGAPILRIATLADHLDGSIAGLTGPGNLPLFFVV